MTLPASVIVGQNLNESRISGQASGDVQGFQVRWHRINSPVFPIAIETAGTYDARARELIDEIDRRITDMTEDSKETIYLYQRISIIIQRGNAISFLHTFDYDDETDTIAVI